MEAYLDNSATTPVSQGVKEIVIKTMMEDYGNPSSMHMKGVEAERYLRQAKEILAKILKVNEKEIIFTSGGTESNNTIIRGIVALNKKIQNNEQYLDIKRAMENLKASLKLKIQHSELSAEQIRVIAEKIDQAAVNIARL